MVGTEAESNLLIDLCDVSFVDGPGEQLLSEMHRAGASLVGSSPMIKALIEGIAVDTRSSRGETKRTRSLLALLFGFLLMSNHNFHFIEIGSGPAGQEEAIAGAKLPTGLAVVARLTLPEGSMYCPWPQFPSQFQGLWFNFYSQFRVEGRNL